ncbi:SGNH/GDSL hydrolase family protein [Kutzneria sp. CA-103260]|uniref:SGNH/GDSL hydrolase family protein n=1 Tax=Kutzneria sp. CA-103260 TaxID=2802641 RepID=UPI001BAD9F13|nr:SGNH/GDSL hydrolase family protein [Kutzneria sp. CA-103260]QUQ65656.1 hydrolase [Kutzneria sp. CA-103260]
MSTVVSFFRRRGLAVVAALGTLLATSSAVASAAEEPLNSEYVALGDSFAAGPLLLPQDGYHLDPCFQSSVDYAHLVAKALNAKTFRDVTCSSATTDNILTTPQKPYLPTSPSVPLQIGAVTPSTTLVTISIGANDLGLATLALTCLNVLPEPHGTSCKDTETAGGVDQGAEAVAAEAPRLANVLDVVHQKAPHARILITSYANYIQPGGCYPLQPVWARDADYIQGLVNQLGQVTKTVAAQHNAEYVDFIAPGVGHDGCHLTQNWVNVVVPGTTLGIVPLHPTWLGEQNFARIVEEHLAGAN